MKTEKDRDRVCLAQQKGPAHENYFNENYSKMRLTNKLLAQCRIDNVRCYGEIRCKSNAQHVQCVNEFLW